MSNCTWHIDGTSPSPEHQREVFVFGSNLDGQHSGGAAFESWKNFGAKYSLSMGYVGENCYGIATLDHSRDKIDLSLIKAQIEILRLTVESHNNMEFFITRIGCGIAGFKDEQIAPLFKGFQLLPNVSLPDNWKQYLID